MRSQAEPHAERLAWQQDSWSSIELKVGQSLTLPSNWNGDPLDFNRIEDHYIETVLGQRALESEGSKSGVLKTRSAKYFDGRHGADIAYDNEEMARQAQVILHRHFGLENRLAQVDKPRPLFYYWVGREPLHEALAKARFQGESQVIGRDCDVFVFSNVGLTGHQDHVYHLDKVTSAPLKVEFYREAEDREAGRLLLVWTAKSLDTVQGYPIVRESIQQDYTGEGDTLDMIREYRVESIAFNKEFPKSTFSPELQPGAVVFDTITGRPAYQVPGAEGADDGPSHTHATPVANPVRAEPPVPWSTYAAPTSIALGLAILTTSLLLWWRRG